MAGPFRRTRHFLAYIIAKIFLTVVQITPRPAMLVIASTIGRILGSLPLPYRKVIRQNLNTVYGDTKSDREKRKITSDLFSNLGKTLCDAIKVPLLSPEKFRKVVRADLSSVQTVLDQQKTGAVIAGSHLSCFELQSHIFAMHGLPIMAIGAELFDKRIDKEVEKLRTRNGVKYLTRNGAGRRLIKELKENRIFVSLIDQDTTNDGVFARFLNKLAYTPSGPIRIAQKFDIPLFFLSLERQRNNSYDFRIEGPIVSPNSGDEQKDIVTIAQQFNDFISAQIMKCPEQWVWMHRRWKRQREDYPDTASITDYEATK